MSWHQWGQMPQDHQSSRTTTRNTSTQQFTLHTVPLTICEIIQSRWAQCRATIRFCNFKKAFAYLGPKDGPVYVGSEDRRGGEQSGVSRWHYSCGYASGADNGDDGWCEVLQGNGQGKSCLPTFKWRRRTIGGQVPVCGMDTKDRKKNVIGQRSFAYVILM